MRGDLGLRQSSIVGLKALRLKAGIYYGAHLGPGLVAEGSGRNSSEPHSGLACHAVVDFDAELSMQKR